MFEREGAKAGVLLQKCILILTKVKQILLLPSERRTPGKTINNCFVWRQASQNSVLRAVCRIFLITSRDGKTNTVPSLDGEGGEAGWGDHAAD